jgi:excisionase family DNA binding protein
MAARGVKSQSHTGAVETPRIALTPREAAAALGVGRTYFYAHVMPELRVIRLGRKTLIPVRELERWTDRAASLIV